MTRMQQPMVGFKRGIPAVNAPAWLFPLTTIEGPEAGRTHEEANLDLTAPIALWYAARALDDPEPCVIPAIRSG